ncbi:MAG: DUF2092 domain-containing protein [Candidatus Omnitrophica bacterium]|nr:DUF2092 domain-containing protein [Candidatus Omnitrophota bacterium]
MFLKKSFVLTMCMVVMLAASGYAWAQSMDKRALDELKLMSDTLSQAKTVSFQARSMVPIRTQDGIWINLYGTSQVVMQGPDKLFANTAGDFKPYDFYFDGKTITRYSPDKNLYAVKEMPGTIDDMIEKAYREEGKSFPYADILISEPYAAMTDGLVRALYIGQSTIRPLSGPGGVKTNHLALSNKGVEWQIWIGTEDHLPRLVCATYLDDASEPSYTVELGDWKLNAEVNAETFIFKNVSNAAKVEFLDPMRQGRRIPGDTADEKAAKGGRP